MLRTRIRFTLGTLLTALLALTWSAAPAHAAFPGKNGRIVVAADLGKGFQLYTIAADGSTYQRITHFKDKGQFYMGSAWAPDGRTIAFDRADENGEQSIWTMNADGSDMTQLPHDPGGSDGGARYSYDGAKIVFNRFVDVGSIWTMNADGTGKAQLTGDGSDSFCPTYAPDGRIYFDSSKGGLISAIWVMNADGSGRHRLTDPALRAGCPNVSPDGTKVVFYDNQNGTNPNSIWTMNADGTGLTQLTFETYHHDVGPKFSPNGRKIVFASDRPYFDDCCFDLFEMNVDGSNVVQVTSNLTVNGCPENGNCAAPDWGPKP